MTEVGWLRSVKPSVMLHCLSHGQSQRKFRLFAIAVARIAWGSDEPTSLRSQLLKHVEFAVEEPAEAKNTFTLGGVYLATSDPNGMIHSTARTAALWSVRIGDEPGAHSVDAVTQAAFIRDIFGNPFRPVAFDPSWRTSSAVGVAQAMYDARDFAAMPILADALEDAGCDSPDVLAHCRGDGPHVRGCWVVDHVLGKA
jgi:hypothetical protein